MEDEGIEDKLIDEWMKEEQIDVGMDGDILIAG